MNYLNIPLLIIGVCGLLSSCQKDEEILRDDIPQVISIQKTSGGIHNMTFYYNSRGECEVAITETFNMTEQATLFYTDGVLDYITINLEGYEPRDKKALVYDEQGRMVSVVHQVKEGGTDEWGRVVAIDSFYYEDDVLAESRMYLASIEGEFIIEQTYLYAYEDNMVEVTINKDEDDDKVQRFYYDEMKAFSDNPGLIYVRERTFHDPDYFMGHNKIAGNYTETPFTSTYTYNEYDMPERVDHSGTIYEYSYDIK